MGQSPCVCLHRGRANVGCRRRVRPGMVLSDGNCRSGSLLARLRGPCNLVARTRSCVATRQSRRRSCSLAWAVPLCLAAAVGVCGGRARELLLRTGKRRKDSTGAGYKKTSQRWTEQECGYRCGGARLDFCSGPACLYSVGASSGVTLF
jgi:hypothetical protein